MARLEQAHFVIRCSNCRKRIHKGNDYMRANDASGRFKYKPRTRAQAMNMRNRPTVKLSICMECWGEDE